MDGNELGEDSLMLAGAFAADVPDEILPGLYLGGASCAVDKEALKGLGITHILVAAVGLRAEFLEVRLYARPL